MGLLAAGVAPRAAFRPKAQYASELPGFKIMNTRQVFLLPRTWSAARHPKSRQASAAEPTSNSTSPPSSSFFGFAFMAQIYRTHDRSRPTSGSYLLLWVAVLFVIFQTPLTRTSEWKSIQSSPNKSTTPAASPI